MWCHQSLRQARQRHRLPRRVNITQTVPWPRIYPDLSVVFGELQLETDAGNVLHNPIMLVEVLSDSTEAYDRGKKFEHYRTNPSLQYYVMIAHDRHSIDCFLRTDSRSRPRIARITRIKLHVRRWIRAVPKSYRAASASATSFLRNSRSDTFLGSNNPLSIP